MNNFRKESAFTLTEVLVALSLAAVLTATATANFARYRRHVRDLTAQLDVRNMAVALQAEQLADVTPNSFFFTRVGPTQMPIPLQSITLSKDTEMTVAKVQASFTFFNNSVTFNYRYIYGFHQSGCNAFYRLDYQYTFNNGEYEIHYNEKEPRPGAPSDC